MVSVNTYWKTTLWHCRSVHRTVIYTPVLTRLHQLLAVPAPVHSPRFSVHLPCHQLRIVSWRFSSPYQRTLWPDFCIQSQRFQHRSHRLGWESTEWRTERHKENCRYPAIRNLNHGTSRIITRRWLAKTPWLQAVFIWLMGHDRTCSRWLQSIKFVPNIFQHRLGEQIGGQ